MKVYLLKYLILNLFKFCTFFNFRVLCGLVVFSFLVSCDGNRQVPVFDGNNAFEFLKNQCEFGARIPGSSAHQQCQKYLTAELKKVGGLVFLQRFKEALPHGGQPVDLVNIVGSFYPEKTNRVLLCAHWDSRPWADQDSLETNRKSPVMGANDGASGVAVLLEVARHLQQSEPEYGIDIVFFDAEDSGVNGKNETYAIGSNYFAENKDSGYRPQFGILLDMVGDNNLQIYQEINSLRYAPQIVKKVWQRAADLGLPAFQAEPRFEVTDDHVPLIKAGIPCIDIIDFDYKYWHTTQDTPDKCSPESLQQVGQLILSIIYDK